MPLDIKTELDIMMKQYDALVSELRETIRVLTPMNFTITFAVAAALFGVRGEVYLTLAVFFIPAVVLMSMALSRAGHWEAEDLGSQIARVEDKVYRLTKRPLLTHETELYYRRAFHDKRHRLLRRDLVSLGLYVTIEWILFWYLDDTIFRKTFPREFQRFLLVVVLSIPPLRLMHFSRKIAHLRSMCVVSDLMKVIMSYYATPQEETQYRRVAADEVRVRTRYYELEKAVLAPLPPEA